MTDYVKIIGDKIIAGIPIVLYTVGGDTFSVVRQLKARYGLKPVAVCDRDTAKQGHEYRGLAGIPVMSFVEANSRWPNAEYFISSMNYRFEIMGELVHDGKLPAEHIINWEPVEKRTSCKFWEGLICVDHLQHFRYCWEPEARTPRILFRDDMNAAVSAFAHLRADFISGKKGLNEVCDKCLYVKDDWYPVSRKAWWINYFGQGVCNFKCKYCASYGHAVKEAKDSSPCLDEIINLFRTEGMLSDFYSIVLSTCGEPTLHPQRKEFYDAFGGYALNLNTNGSIFDNDLFVLMQTKIARLIVSIDAGTSEKYKEIKGVDSFDKVKENLKKYQEAAVGIVVPKYVVTPGINDDTENIDGFCEICEDLGVPYAIAAYDYYSLRPIPEQSVDMLLRLKNNLEGAGILCAPYTECYSYDYCSMLDKVFHP